MRTERLSLFAIATLLGACLDPVAVSPGANAILVHAVLDGRARTQRVYIQTTTDAAGTVDAAGATVTLTLPDGRTVAATQKTDTIPPAISFLSPVIRTDYRFSLDNLAFEIVPGSTYRLRVQLSDGRVVTGHTTIPNATPASLAGPIQSFNPLSDTIALSWARVAGARSYEVAVYYDTTLAPRSVFADTAIRLHGSSVDMDGSNLFSSSSFTGGARYRLLVAAVDSNYYDYYRRAGSVLVSTVDGGHVDGGHGVVGAIVVIAARTLTTP